MAKPIAKTPVFEGEDAIGQCCILVGKCLNLL